MSTWKWNDWSKYGNKKTEIDGITFDSKKEANRYADLKICERCGIIKNLQRQVKYTLIRGQRWRSDGKKHRDTIYIADFVYEDMDGNIIVEDVKGFRTDAYRIKRELMKMLYDIEVQEV